MTQALSIDPITAYLADKAASNYAAHADQISRIAQRISENRNGFFPLTDISDDKNRLLNRAVREGGQFEQALERINGIPNFQDVAIMRKIVRASTSESATSFPFVTGKCLVKSPLLNQNSFQRVKSGIRWPSVSTSCTLFRSVGFARIKAPGSRFASAAITMA